MHFFIFIVLGIFTVGLLLILASFYINEAALTGIGLILIAITGLLQLPANLNAFSTKVYPVAYTTEQITDRIFVHTSYGEFESDKKKDFDQWTKGLDGFIEQDYNAYGAEVLSDQQRNSKRFKVQEK